MQNVAPVAIFGTIILLPYLQVTESRWQGTRRFHLLQWNLSVTTTSLIKLITCDLFSNVF